MLKKICTIISLVSLMIIVNHRFVFAQAKYNIKEMTPQVQAALDNRRDRFEKLKELKTNGIIGENNRGYVEVLINDQGGEALAEEENKDRKVIYETIAEQNGLKDALSTIEFVFAQVQRDKAEAGQKIQNEDGSWTVKQ